MTTNPDLDQAREWAKPVHPGHHPEAVAAARVIAALPDEWIDAEELAGQAAQLRALYNAIEHTSVDKVNDLFFRALVSTIGAHVEMLEALFPAPKPRTLADLLAAGHAPDQYQWMQADFRDRSAGRTTRIVITRANRNVADVVFPSGAVSCVYSDKLTPLPGRPRMVWPEEQATEEDMSIIPPKIDTSTGHDDYVDMTPEDVKPGEVWVVRCGDGQAVGMRQDSEDRPWYVMWDDQDLQIEGLWLGDKDITLVSRLVPEKEQ